MKKLGFQFITLAFAMLFTLQLSAQDKPAASPLGKVYQRVGVTDVEVTYSRPSAKGRTIFADNGLVPFGKLWRTGANGATTISVSTAVMIGDQKLDAGTYSILSIPAADEWTIIFNSDASLRGTGGYSEAKDAVRINVPVSAAPALVETFKIYFGTVTDTMTELWIAWENTKVKVPISVEKTW
jgi:hypothetical protein